MNSLQAVLAKPKSRIFSEQSAFTTIFDGFKSCEQLVGRDVGRGRDWAQDSTSKCGCKCRSDETEESSGEYGDSKSRDSKSRDSKSRDSKSRDAWRERENTEIRQQIELEMKCNMKFKGDKQNSNKTQIIRYNY